MFVGLSFLPHRDKEIPSTQPLLTPDSLSLAVSSLASTVSLVDLQMQMMTAAIIAAGRSGSSSSTSAAAAASGKAEGEDDAKSKVLQTLQVPYCIDVSATVFNALHALLHKVIPLAEAETSRSTCIVFGILCLCVFVCVRVCSCVFVCVRAYHLCRNTVLSLACVVCFKQLCRVFRCRCAFCSWPRGLVC